MNTLIRVRGKRGNLKRKRENLTQHRDEAKQERDKERQTESEKLSYLERLPVEILQRIFIESRSPRMAQASKRLQTQLLSDYTKLQMTIACFKDLDIDGWSEWEWQLEDHLAIMRLWVLLRQKWFTFPLFQAARHEWLMETSVLEVARMFADDDEMMDKEGIRDIRKRIRSMFAWLLTEGRKGMSDAQAWVLRLPEKRQQPQPEDHDGVCYFTHGTEAAWLTFTPSTAVQRGFPTCDWNQICIRRHGRKKITRHKFLVSIRSIRHIPPELASAPFTQSKGDLLATLLSSETRDHGDLSLLTDPGSFVFQNPDLIPAGVAGLQAALEQRCYPAVALLISAFPRELSQNCQSNSVKTPPPLDSDEWVTNPVPIWKNADHPYHKLPWSWNRCVASWGGSFYAAILDKTDLHLFATRLHHEPSLYLAILRAHCDYVPGNDPVPPDTLNILYQQSQRQKDPLVGAQIRNIYDLYLMRNEDLIRRRRLKDARANTMSWQW